ncbi:alkaline phosphatase family protein [Caulobacter sp. S45]|uniref:alkaline phosphatase family protein n=1 Tax=Caulobacter sp. S45 TaxID=1641861 RepID=UPI001C204796|nr:alkaline phosphatase family protein [Caulobacter sp. S45]
MMENEEINITFGHVSKAIYLSKDLASQGALLTRYYGTAHNSLGNYLAMISGQGVNATTQDDCEVFEPFVQTGWAAYGQAVGKGCVYPKAVHTIADQLTASGLNWKGYMEDMGADPTREAARCGHPAIGTKDRTQVATPKDQYAARHDPFVYFHSIIDSPTCERAVVPLPALATDLADIATTPALSYIVPNLCHDGHDGAGGEGCVDHEASGLATVDDFLKTWVPRIMASPAYKQDGLIIITFDESDMHHRRDKVNKRDVLYGDASACCGELPGPNIDRKAKVEGTTIQGPGIIGPGGGQIGAVMLSPFIAPGTVSNLPYNHYSLLRTLEDIFHLPHLGYAAQPSAKPMGRDVFNVVGGVGSGGG